MFRNLSNFSRLRTGGPLNHINEAYGINKPQRSVPIMRLLQVHRPVSEKAVVDLISSHQGHRCVMCDCETVNGGLQGWSQSLHKAAQKEGHQEISLKDCSNFIYDLYVRAPLRGQLMEDKALTDLKKHFHGYPNMDFRIATTQEDLVYAVDIVISRHNHIICGVQVKSINFKSNNNAMNINKEKNKAWSHHVTYLYYDNDGKWINLLSCISAINEQLRLNKSCE
jgi:hypothetical protein